MSEQSTPQAHSGGRPVLRRGVRLVHDPVRDRHALLYPEGVLLLNHTAAAVLRRCDGATSTEDIIAGLAADYRDVARPDVTDLLDRLRDRRLLEVRRG
ncbi:pyrroloquinoline quinone biosynthesis peptide chaperone PqqD [Goodfellowiella coeruleoviolacea]|uniref:Pyrroloquinoline quinone biosynthesis protein D n=1 Tax=Goodfellowiella coeruleoviolacea TaxID=334858 RepID=A0AAE3G9M8_9PSEU|nr:pyrroloquinoline quinone biosynthesis peptide chaperone PqqD [Goodfellowiella coeruleoviolacea]MCP2164095.1 pyrroloquinoline quinone biosynthesis protein D [Goodfellowiella coeruleoviolacea]